ncbi:hypothetical protein HCZ30_00910 [Marivivens donghaensis]|uniref:Uncharacterized protein n=1 Tax=Marivivens donghaensis TaxID=1699413 RepID=A0ABX0VT47_9RHOB|nr:MULTISPECIES: hypothetical protein [Marivivens]NIY70991.1 hypothetical protein [Marivivens donghaensis]
MYAILLPAVALAVVGWLIPQLIAKFLPEGLKPLAINAVISILVMMLIGICFFIGLYVIQGFPIFELLDAGFTAVLEHFVPLAAISALLWGPVLVLSIANLPRHWSKVVW